MKIKYSVNPKLNRFLIKIQELLLHKGNTSEESIQIIRRYKESFPKEPDHNLAQHGGMCVSAWDVKNMLKSCGYVLAKHSDDKVWHKYLEQVGFVARKLLREYDNLKNNSKHE